MNILLIGLGGAIGAMLRYLGAGMVGRWLGPGFPGARLS